MLEQLLWRVDNGRLLYSQVAEGGPMLHLRVLIILLLLLVQSSRFYRLPVTQNHCEWRSVVLD